MLIEVIEYLIVHGADPFNVKCGKTGNSAYTFAMQKQTEFNRKKVQLKGQNIYDKIIETLINTKQKVFHPQVKNGRYRDSKQKSQGSYFLDNSQREMLGCCGCASFPNIFSY